MLYELLYQDYRLNDKVLLNLQALYNTRISLKI